MAKRIINVGNEANDKKGDSLRSAFTKVNENFTELYTALGLVSDTDLNLGSFEFDGSIMTTTDSTPITIDQQVNITSDLVMSGDVVPATTNTYNLGSPNKQWRSLYLTGSTVYFDGVPLSVTDDGTILVNGAVAATPGGAATWDSVTSKPSMFDIGGNVIGIASSETITEETIDGTISQTTTVESQIEIEAESIVIAKRVRQVTDDTVVVTTDEAGCSITVNNSGVFIKKYAEPDGPNNTSYFQVRTNNGAILEAVQEDVADETYGRVIAAQGVVEIATRADGVEKNWGFSYDGTMVVPTNSTILGTNDLTIRTESDGNSGLFLNSSPLVGTAVLYATNNAVITADYDGNRKDWNFDKSGTITVPLLLPKMFTAVLDEAHMIVPVTLAAEPWQYGVAFAVNPNGSVETQMDDPTPTVDPGYVQGSVFRFTEEDHGIPGYTFDIILNFTFDEEAGVFVTNPSVTAPPEYPATIESTGAIKLTANTSNFVFGTDGSITFPDGSFQGTAFVGLASTAQDLYKPGEIFVGIGDGVTTTQQWTFGTDGTLTLPSGGDIVDSTGTSVLGGGGSIAVGTGTGPSIENVTEILINGTVTEIEPGLVGISVSGGTVQPYIELTNDPFITQPVTFGDPVSVTAPVSGQGATFDVVIGAGPALLLTAINNPGTGYVTGQRYKIWFYQIGGSTDTSLNITFEIETVGELGEILSTSTPLFIGVTGDNIPGNYDGVSIELTSSVRDEISPGVVLTRSLNQGLYNLVAETEYDNSTYLSPLNTEWNSDGWDNLVGVGGRDFTTFRAALGGQVGNNVVGAELVMRDVTTDRYYKFEFYSWGLNNGGSYSYTRTEITDPNFFAKTAGGSEVDVIIADDGEGAGIGITRGANYDGIYNLYREGVWNSNVSPTGTQWNLDGWDDLSDIESRVYTNFNTAYAGNFGVTVEGSKAVMYVADTDTYYAVEWLSWADDGTGTFSYVRYELDLSKINEGVRFPDGSVLKSAAGVGRVKSTASGGRRIEEVSGSNAVSVTAVTTNYITATASRSVVNDDRFWVSNTDTIIAAIIDNPNAYDILDYATIQFSLDNITWYTYNGGYSGTAEEIGVSTNALHTYNQGDTIYFKYDGGGAPQVWWNKSDLPGGGNDFRGAVIDYHAYTGEGTIIGTIHIVDDSGEEHISHTEVASGSTDSENDDLWLVQNEGTISYRRIDGESKTLKIHWTAKVFYGEEFYD